MNTELIDQKMKKIKTELGEQAISPENVTEVLKKLHPEVSPETLQQGIQEIVQGIDQLYQTQIDLENGSAAEILSGQMEGMNEEQQKGYLCQLFDSIKASDQAADGEIEKAQVDGTDLAQMSAQELQQLVSHQLVNSINGMAYSTLEGNIEEIASMKEASLRTREDALLLAAAQYSEALEGNIPFEYTRFPRVLGQCAAAQTRIVAYCEEMEQSDIPEDEKQNKIRHFIEMLVSLLVFVIFSVLIGVSAAGLLAVTFEAVTALLGTGIIAVIAQLLLIYPVIWVAFAAVIGTGILTSKAVKSVCRLFQEAAPKIRQLYGKLVEMLRGWNPFKATEGSAEKAEEEKWDSDDIYAEEADLAEEDLAYT